MHDSCAPPPPTRWPWLLGLQIPLRLCQPVHFEHLCSRTIRGFGVPPSSLLAVTSAPPSHTASHPQSLRLPRRNPSTLRLPCLSPLPANFLTNPQSLHASRTPTLLQGAPRPLFLFLSQEPLRRGPLELTYPHLPIPSAPPHPFSWRTPPHQSCPSLDAKLASAPPLAGRTPPDRAILVA